MGVFDAVEAAEDSFEGDATVSPRSKACVDGES